MRFLTSRLLCAFRNCFESEMRISFILLICLILIRAQLMLRIRTGYISILSRRSKQLGLWTLLCLVQSVGMRDVVAVPRWMVHRATLTSCKMQLCHTVQPPTWTGHSWWIHGVVCEESCSKQKVKSSEVQAIKSSESYDQLFFSTPYKM